MPITIIVILVIIMIAVVIIIIIIIIIIITTTIISIIIIIMIIIIIIIIVFIIVKILLSLSSSLLSYIFIYTTGQKFGIFGKHNGNSSIWHLNRNLQKSIIFNISPKISHSFQGIQNYMVNLWK